MNIFLVAVTLTLPLSRLIMSPPNMLLSLFVLQVATGRIETFIGS
jgi:hypothetical protein